MVSQTLGCVRVLGLFLSILSSLLLLGYSFIFLDRIQIILSTPLFTLLLNNKMHSSNSKAESAEAAFDEQALLQLRIYLTALLEEQERTQGQLEPQLESQISVLAHHCQSGELNEEWSRACLEFLQGVRSSVLQRCQTLRTVSHLGVKMIDYIGEQQELLRRLGEQYQAEVDALRYENSCLSSKNISIENDYEYFKGHLESVEGELERLAQQQSEQKNSSNIQEMDITIEKDKQIIKLQRQMERLKNQLSMLKVNRKQSRRYLRSNSLKYIRGKSLGSLLGSSSSDEKFIPNLHLQTLQNYSVPYSQQGKSLKIDSIDHFQPIREELVQQTERQFHNQQDIALNFQNEVRMISKSSSAHSIIQPNSLHGDLQSSMEQEIIRQPRLRLLNAESNRSLFWNVQISDYIKNASRSNFHQEQYTNPSKKNLKVQKVIQETVASTTSLLISKGVQAQTTKQSTQSTETNPPKLYKQIMDLLEIERKKIVQKYITKPLSSLLLKFAWNTGTIKVKIS